MQLVSPATAGHASSWTEVLVDAFPAQKQLTPLA